MTVTCSEVHQTTFSNDINLITVSESVADDVLAGSDYFSGVLKKHTETAEVEYSALYNEKVAALDLGAFYTAVSDARDALYTDYMAQQEASGETENTEEAVG